MKPTLEIKATIAMGTVVDCNGTPTTSPTLYLQRMKGALYPMRWSLDKPELTPYVNNKGEVWGGCTGII